MRKSSKLIITRVQGKTVGGGVGLIAASDYAIGTKSASVRLSELLLGIGPFVVGPAIQRKIGMQGFAKLSLDAASWNSAEWAYQRGLYTELVESIDELDQHTQELASQLADYNPKATKELKRALWDDASNWDTLLEIRADTSGRLLMTDYAQKKLSKLKEK
jgi:methylglutaconyl-CoA hydratase